MGHQANSGDQGLTKHETPTIAMTNNNYSAKSFYLIQCVYVIKSDENLIQLKTDLAVDSVP